MALGTRSRKLSNMSDGHLAALVAEADRDAAELIVRRHWPDAYRVAFLLVRDEPLAEDVAQETMLAMVRAIAGFEHGAALRPWIERIAANRACDLLRRKKRRPELIVGQLPEEPPGAVERSDSLAAVLAASVPPDHLMRALAEIDSDQRSAVILRHLLDYEPAEIAEIVGATVGAVRSRIHRGLHELRRILDTQEGEQRHERVG